MKFQKHAGGFLGKEYVKKVGIVEEKNQTGDERRPESTVENV